MKDKLSRIREAEDAAQKRISVARKSLSAELSSAHDRTDEEHVTADHRAAKIVSRAVEDAENRAKARGQEMTDAQEKDIEELKKRVENRMKKAIDHIVSEFKKWQ